MPELIELEFPITLPNGDEIDLIATCEVGEDPDYGADADGNRGVPILTRGPIVIQNMNEVMRAIEDSVDGMQEEFFDTFRDLQEETEEDEEDIT